jgi:hypothetical protein
MWSSDNLAATRGKSLVLAAEIERRRMNMTSAIYTNEASAGRAGRRSWNIAFTRRYGLQCAFDRTKADDASGHSTVKDWYAGSVRVLRLELGWQRLTPVERDAPAWHEENLLLKVVQHGTITLEQHGDRQTIGAGRMVLVDPRHSFTETFHAQTKLVSLSMPKLAMRNRGLRDRLMRPLAADPASADVEAVKDFVLLIAARSASTSEPLRGRLAEYCLDLMDALVDDPSTAAQRRSSAATLLRAKQAIARLAGNPQLDCTAIAAHLKCV